MRFMDFIPSGIKVCLSKRPPTFLKYGDIAKTRKSCYLISNITSMAEVFSRADHKFDLLYSKRAFIHWYNDMEQD